MSYTSQLSYNRTGVVERRPPLMLIGRTVEFSCGICGQLGVGPPNSRVHSGACRKALTALHMKRNNERARKRKLAARALVTIPFRPMLEALNA